MQAWVNGIELSWRGILYPYTNSDPNVFDCPSEQLEDQYYANGAFDDRGQPNADETFIPSGIGAVNVHYNCGEKFRPAFGRYNDPLYGATYGASRAPVLKWSVVEDASRMIFLGDGHSNFAADAPNSDSSLYPKDEFWIFMETNRCDPGYDRSDNPAIGGKREKGLERHGGPNDANYAFGDGSAKLLDSSEIPCRFGECWWDAQINPHGTQVGSGGGGPVF